MGIGHPDFMNTTSWKWGYFLATWASIGGVALLLMLNHTSDDGVFFGRYSWSYAAMLGVMGLSTGLLTVTAFLAWQKRFPDLGRFLPRNPMMMWAAVIGGIIGLALFWLLLPGARFFPAVALFLVYSTASFFVVWVFILRHMGAGQIQVPVGAMVGLALAVSIITIGLVMRYVGRVPPSLILDEPWLLGWGYSMFTTGKPFIAMYPTFPAEYVALWSILMPLQGAWSALTGISLESGRLFWLLITWCSAPFIYLTARDAYGKFAAWVAVCLILLLPLPHNYLRSDMAVPLSLSAGLYYFFSARRTGQKWRFFASGIFFATVVEGHTLAICFIIAIGVLLTLEYAAQIGQRRRLFWNSHYVAFVAGGITYAILFIFLHTFLWGFSPFDLLTTIDGYYGLNADLGMGAGSGMTRIINNGVAWVVNYLVIHPLEFCLFISGVAFAMWRRQAADRWLAALVLVALPVLFVLLPKHNIYYWIHFLPFTALFTGAFFAQLFPQPPLATRLTVAQAAVLAVMVALAASQIIVAGRNTQNADRAIAISYEIDAVLPAEVHDIWGWQVYYYGLSGRRFVNIESFTTQPDTQWMQRFEVPAPQAIIITRGLDDVHQKIWAYIEQRGMMLAQCFPLDIYGQEVLLFMLPQFTPPDAPIHCR